MTRPRTRSQARARHGADDGDTRGKLLEVARELFADRGFDGVSTREICQAADANVAAIHYHFGDKLGLYAVVIESAIDVMREASAQSMQGPEVPAPERLRVYIRAQLERMLLRHHTSWIFRLMNREIENPTPELDRIVRAAVKPRIEYLGAIVAELMGCPPADGRVGVAVASIHGAVMLFARAPIIVRLLPGRPSMAESLDPLAELVTRYAMGGIRALA